MRNSSQSPTVDGASDGMLPTTSCSAGPLTAEMIREMLGHVPFDVGDMPARWEWMANYLNETLRDPGVICPCCNITRRGELMDHLPPPPRPSLPNVRPLATPPLTSQYEAQK